MLGLEGQKQANPLPGLRALAALVVPVGADCEEGARAVPLLGPLLLLLLLLELLRLLSAVLLL